MSKDIKALLAQKLAENNARHTNSNQMAYLEFSTELKSLPLDKIKPNPYQPRLFFDEKELNLLAKSIEKNGLLQPITVREMSNSSYEIIAGERRFRAHNLLGKTHIDAIITQANDSDVALLALAENASRKDLCDFEISKALLQIQQFFPTKTHLAQSIGIERKEMYRYLSYADLPSFLLNKLSTNPKLISRSTAYELKQFFRQISVSDEKLIKILEQLWNLLEQGKIEQNKITSFISQKIDDKSSLKKASILDSKFITINDNPIGKFYFKRNKYFVEINSISLSNEQRNEIEKSIQIILEK